MEPSQWFETWAPPESPWSGWAKPTLFAQIRRAQTFGTPPTRHAVGALLADGSWIPPLGDRAAVVVDVPGADSVWVGLELARRGYRPVPLYNTTNGPSPVIALEPLLSALVHGAAELPRLRIDPDAPPAFLIDAARLRGAALAGSFDNRWALFPQDMPSGSLLVSRRIGRVLVVRSRSVNAESDLLRVLSRYSRAGLRLTLKELERHGPAVPYTVATDLSFRLGAMVRGFTRGLRRSSVGGFGGRVPDGSSHGGMA